MNRNIRDFSLEKFVKAHTDESFWVAKWFNMNKIGFAVFDYSVNLLVASRMGIQYDQAEYLGEIIKGQYLAYLHCPDCQKINLIPDSILDENRDDLSRRLSTIIFENIEMTAV